MEMPSERIDRIMFDVAEAHYTTVAAIRGSARDRDTVDARRSVCFVLREHGLSSTQIGAKINRDHTSVLNLLGLLKRNRDRQQKRQEG
jgi:chromosomal replication initiation ATPase DnaA